MRLVALNNEASTGYAWPNLGQIRYFQVLRDLSSRGYTPNPKTDRVVEDICCCLFFRMHVIHPQNCLKAVSLANL